MLQNVTFSAEKTLIHKARLRAKAENTTLNAEFRQWLEQYAERLHSEADFMALMARLDYVNPGRSFSRDEMNER
jgi:hypothetical protein